MISSEFEKKKYSYIKPRCLRSLLNYGKQPKTANACDNADCFCGIADQWKVFCLLPAGTIVRVSHRRVSPAHFEQDMNLHRT